MTPPSASTRLAHQRYLDLLAADSARLAAAAGGRLDVAVPYCDEWRVRDLVTHAGEVWGQKATILAERRPPGGDWPDDPAPGAGADVLAWHGEQRQRLLDAFAGLDPDQPVLSWADTEQNVRFWGRRMAQEALIHRIDAEAAAGELTPADPALVVDGIDELLGIYLTSIEWRTPPGGSGKAVLVRAGDWQWRSILDHDGFRYSTEPGPAEATVSGEPFTVLLWLWGRAPEEAVAVQGDTALLEKFRGLLRRATQ